MIIAAGKGNRLQPMTSDLPKCLLKVGSKTIMQRTLDVLEQSAIRDIAIVRGYKKELIDYSHVVYYENTNYENNNILSSLFYAEAAMDDGFVFSYSDIIFEQSVLQKLLQSRADVSLIIDVNWLSHYQGRRLHPVEEAEIVTVKKGKVTKIGKKIIKPEDAYGEFIGLAKFSKRGARLLKEHYRRVQSHYNNRPFQQAASLEKAYLTDMIQELIDQGVTVRNVDINGHWTEIDTPEDLERARENDRFND